MTTPDSPSLPSSAIGDGWYPCSCCDGEGGSNAGPLPDHIDRIAALEKVAAAARPLVVQRMPGLDRATRASEFNARLEALRRALAESPPANQEVTK